MPSPLTDVGVETPILAAPMAGSLTAPELVVAAAGAGGLGLSLFAPAPLPVDAAAYRAIAPEAGAYGLRDPGHRGRRPLGGQGRSPALLPRSGRRLHMRYSGGRRHQELRSAKRVPLPLVAAGGIATHRDRGLCRPGRRQSWWALSCGARSKRGPRFLPRRTRRSGPPWDRGDANVHQPPGGALRAFTDRYSKVAPYGYPALHHMTSTLRSAATAAHDAGRIILWAGTGYRQATAELAVRILRRLASRA